MLYSRVDGPFNTHSIVQSVVDSAHTYANELLCKSAGLRIAFPWAKSIHRPPSARPSPAARPMTFSPPASRSWWNVLSRFYAGGGECDQDKAACCKPCVRCVLRVSLPHVRGYMFCREGRAYVSATPSEGVRSLFPARSRYPCPVLKSFTIIESAELCLHMYATASHVDVTSLGSALAFELALAVFGRKDSA